LIIKKYNEHSILNLKSVTLQKNSGMNLLNLIKMKNKSKFFGLSLFVIGLCLFFVIGCEKEKKEDVGSFTDKRDGNVYNWITIGDQIWMSENLRYLPSVVESDTGSNSTAYYYVYEYNGTDVNAAKATANYTTYGVLYNWSAACSSCPTGWHLPTDAEWNELVDYLGGESGAGGKLKETGTTHWNSPNTATNETGFTALPGGARGNNSGSFCNIGTTCFWWSATEDGTEDAWGWDVYYSGSHVYKRIGNKALGFSVRCIKD